MKKDNNTVYFGVFFVVSVLAELYCIIEGINILGVSIVVVIASYLLLDSWRTYQTKREQRMDQRIEEIEKIGKALYVQGKKHELSLKDSMKLMKKERKEELTQLVECQNKAAKAIIKYAHDDMRHSKSIDRSNFEKLAATLLQGSYSVPSNIPETLTSYEASKQSPIEQTIENEVLEETYEMDALLDETASSEEDIAQNSIQNNKDAAPPQAVISENPNKMMSPDEIAAMLAAANPPSEEVKKTEPVPVQNSNQMMSPDEIAAMLAAVNPPEEESKDEPIHNLDQPLGNDEISRMFDAIGDGVTNPTKSDTIQPDKAPMPEIDLPDSNNPLSAEEIASLFDSIK